MEEENVSKNSLDEEKIAALLLAGESVKINIYHQILQKVAASEPISPSELKTFETLHAQLKSGTITDQPTVDHETFRTAAEIYAYLYSSGYKLSRATLYRAVSSGKLRPRKSGVFSIKDVDKFATLYLRPIDGSQPRANDFESSSGYETLQTEKLAAEVAKARAQAEHWAKRNLDLDAEVAARVDQKLAQQAIVLKADLKNFAYAKAPSIIDLVAGNPEKTVDLISFLIDVFDAFLARYAGVAE